MGQSWSLASVFSVGVNRSTEQRQRSRSRGYDSTSIKGGARLGHDNVSVSQQPEPLGHMTGCNWIVRYTVTACGFGAKQVSTDNLGSISVGHLH